MTERVFFFVLLKGWSGHPVCRKRYHFIIRSCECDNEMNGSKNKSCSGSGFVNPSLISELRSQYFLINFLNFFFSFASSLKSELCECRSCKCFCNTDDEEWEHSQLEDTTYLLHGVVHSNGYGHLLTVNGREGGSNLLSGFQIMNFWDRLCTALSVRLLLHLTYFNERT